MSKWLRRVVMESSEEFYPSLKPRDLIIGLTVTLETMGSPGEFPWCGNCDLDKLLGCGSGVFGRHEAVGLERWVQDGLDALQARGGKRTQGKDEALFLPSLLISIPLFPLILKTCIQRLQSQNALDTSSKSGSMVQPAHSWGFLLILESHMEVDIPGVFP